MYCCCWCLRQCSLLRFSQFFSPILFFVLARKRIITHSCFQCIYFTFFFLHFKILRLKIRKLQTCEIQLIFDFSTIRLNEDDDNQPRRACLKNKFYLYLIYQKENSENIEKKYIYVNKIKKLCDIYKKKLKYILKLFLQKPTNKMLNFLIVQITEKIKSDIKKIY